jgi:putative transposase
VKRRLVVEADGGPLGIAMAGAHVHDTQLLAKPLDTIVVKRPAPTAEAPQHLCLDQGDDHPTGHQAAAEYDYTPHIRRIGAEKFAARRRKRYPARRGVVERTWGWLSTCRARFVRYDTHARNFLGLLQLACALLWLRRRARLLRD